MQERELYCDARRYDLVMGEYAVGDMLEFYRRQISLYGQPALELACGTGRLTIPLAEDGVDIVGLDISPQMLELAERKAQGRHLRVPFVRGDVRAFDLGRRFKFIFIPAQSLSHLHKRDELESCFACVRQHLAEGGRFLIELFNPSVKLLAREPEQPCPVGRGEYEEADGGGRVIVTARARYDAATQVSHIHYHFQSGESEGGVLSFEMRQFFPQEINALLAYNGLRIERKYGDYEEAAFGNDSPKQLIVCQAS
jgi:SAM-dependent methyltransferase